MKTPFFMLMTALGLNVSAQLNKGGSMLSGSFNAYSQNQESSAPSVNGALSKNSINYTSFGITPQYGYFIKDQWMIGVYGSYTSFNSETKTESVSTGQFSINRENSTTNTITGGLFGRYYHMLGKSRFAIYGQLSAAYGNGKSKNENSFVTNTASQRNTSRGENIQIDAFVNPGIVYFISEHLSVEAAFGNLGYNWRRFSVKNDQSGATNEQTTGSFSTNLSFSLQSLALGINFYFGGKKNAKDEVPPRS